MASDPKAIDGGDMAVIADLVARYGADAVINAARGLVQPERKKAGRPKNEKNNDASLVSIWVAIHRAKSAGKSTTDAARALERDYRKNSSGSRLTARALENTYYQIEARRREEPAIRTLCGLFLAGIESVFSQFGIDPTDVLVLPAGGIGLQKR